MLRILVSLCSVSIPTVSMAAGIQTSSVPSDTLLAGITARGRLLAAYDQAAWHGTDAVLAVVPETALAKVGNAMVAMEEGDGSWKDLSGVSPLLETLFTSCTRRGQRRVGTALLSFRMIHPPRCLARSVASPPRCS